ncbi:MAG: hypothetical protein OXC26_00045 [Albidovulum sp.]|nr:hypothetical protein [Albidovulum sp.]
MPEGRRIFADLAVDENLTVGCALVERDRLQANRSRVCETFPKLALRGFQAAGSLSGGKQQMLAIGRAMMFDPELLLVDDLSLGLMPAADGDCYRALNSLREEISAILQVEQSTDRVVEAGDRIAVIETGRIARTGTGAEAARNDAVARAYLGSEPDGRADDSELTGEAKG